MSDDLSRDVSRGVQDAIYRVRINDMALQGIDNLVDGVAQHLDRKVWLAKEAWYWSIYNMSVLSDPHLEGKFTWEPWRQKIQSFKKPMFDQEGKAREVAALINQEFREAGYPVDEMMQTLETRRSHYSSYLDRVAKEEESIAKFGHLVGVDFKNFDEMVAYMGQPNIFTKWIGGPQEISDFCKSIGFLADPDQLVGVFVRETDCDECTTSSTVTHALLVREIDHLAETQMSWWKAQFEPQDDLLLLGNGWGGYLYRAPVCIHMPFENMSLQIAQGLKALTFGYYYPFKTLKDHLSQVEKDFEGKFNFKNWVGMGIDDEEETALKNGQLQVFSYQGPESLGKPVGIKFRIQEAGMYDFWYTDWSYYIEGGCLDIGIAGDTDATLSFGQQFHEAVDEKIRSQN
ncbi:hypothetical protein [Aquiluna sp. KACHI24]|uniref:hypothetical protein n=1 Tax=Aquiluna sp. KACHI24 TaxID=2968831 RepID=UPI00220F53A3|nr:hypothetical protein [Aquiluna sp. KACHI24]BDQ00736.1 hypothetical protein AKACHI_10720 [Aquiluna sp. KACHI24]